MWVYAESGKEIGMIWEDELKAKIKSGEVKWLEPVQEPRVKVKWAGYPVAERRARQMTKARRRRQLLAIRGVGHGLLAMLTAGLIVCGVLAVLFAIGTAKHFL